MRAGRLDKAKQFLDALRLIDALIDDEHDLIDASITLAVHAGIAAADVVCCARLGQHASGDNHAEAVDLLARADPGLAKDLRALLAMKTVAGYGARPSTVTSRRRAGRAATRLVRAASDEL